MSYVSSVSYYKDLLYVLIEKKSISRYEKKSIIKIFQSIQFCYALSEKNMRENWVDEGLTERCSYDLDRLFNKLDLIFSTMFYLGEEEVKISTLIVKYIIFDATHLLYKFDSLKKEAKLLDKIYQWRNLTNKCSYCCLQRSKGKVTGKLNKQIHKVRFFCARMPELNKKELDSINDLFFLPKARVFRGGYFFSKRPVAVLKGGEKRSPAYKEQQATANLEVLSYRLGKSFGFRNYFAPTKLIELETENKTYVGSIQPFIRGKLLRRAMRDGSFENITQRDFILANMATLALGMEDAHANNIFLVKYDLNKEQYRPVFFDNSRNLSPINGVLKRPEGAYMASYRNDLLVSRKSFVALSADDKCLIRECLDKMSDPEVKLKVSRELNLAKEKYPFSEYELQPLFYMNALLLREARMQVNLEKVGSFIDLVFAADPIYEFIMTLRISFEYFNRKEQKSWSAQNMTPRTMSEVFLFCSECLSVEIALLRCVRHYMDVEKLLQFSEETSSWQKWVEVVFGYVDDIKDRRLCHDKQTIQSSYANIFEMLKNDSLPDFKDPFDKRSPKNNDEDVNTRRKKPLISRSAPPGAFSLTKP